VIEPTASNTITTTFFTIVTILVELNLLSNWRDIREGGKDWIGGWIFDLWFLIFGLSVRAQSDDAKAEDQRSKAKDLLLSHYRPHFHNLKV